MKIVVTGTRGFPGVQGGVEKHCEKLYSHLIKHGCDITVFSRKPYVTYPDEKFNGITLIPLSCPQNKFLEAIVHTFKSVLEARKLHPDILHIHAVGPALMTPFARVLGMKVVVTSHGPDYKRKKWSWPAKIFLRWSEWAGMTFASEIIAIAQDISNDIRKKYRRNPAVIPNGVDIPAQVTTSEALKKYGLQEKRYILSVGRFVPEKGFHDLIDAFNNMKGNNWKLVIVGDADHEDKYSRDLKVKAGNNENILLTGFLTGQPLQEIYSHAGLFVLPSSYEGLPIVLLEAMSYGLPCIASDIPANRNVDLGDDRFFRAGDISMLSRKIVYFIQRPWEDTDKRHQVNMIAEKYNWESIADETLKVYKKVFKVS
ncbi:MAG: glycosyltransferase family 1 protein [Nitrospiraceae bacterium]|nr:MAG: glycosyltransferase family 1 protein [Nitrospiraceae bacterium]